MLTAFLTGKKRTLLSLAKKIASHPRRATLKITILSRPRTRLRQTTTTSTTEASLEVCDEGDRYLMKSNFITTLRWRRIWLRRRRD